MRVPESEINDFDLAQWAEEEINDATRRARAAVTVLHAVPRQRNIEMRTLMEQTAELTGTVASLEMALALKTTEVARHAREAKRFQELCQAKNLEAKTLKDELARANSRATEAGKALDLIQSETKVPQATSAGPEVAPVSSVPSILAHLQGSSEISFLGPSESSIVVGGGIAPLAASVATLEPELLDLRQQAKESKVTIRFLKGTVKDQSAKIKKLDSDLEARDREWEKHMDREFAKRCAAKDKEIEDKNSIINCLMLDKSLDASTPSPSKME